jgi:hypothetical protein
VAKDLERKLADIFRQHNARIEQRELDAIAEKRRRTEKVMRMHNHLSQVISPALRELARSVHKAGQRATVVETGPIGSDESSTAQVKITIIPRGYDTADPEELPRLVFQSSPSGITVTECAFFPGSGGKSSTTEPRAPEELGAEKVEAFLLALVKQTFNR